MTEVKNVVFSISKTVKVHQFIAIGGCFLRLLNLKHLIRSIGMLQTRLFDSIAESVTNYLRSLSPDTQTSISLFVMKSVNAICNIPLLTRACRYK